MQTKRAAPAGSASDQEQADRDLGTAWRRAGLALGDLGTDIGDSLRTAWVAAAGREPERTGEGLRRLADLFDRSVETARTAATSEEARSRVNSSARQAGDRLEYAVRLSLAELGRTLERADPAARGEYRRRDEESGLD
jgi:hypothetical protein